MSRAIRPRSAPLVSQAGVYEIVNTVNGDRYIGSSARMDTRWTQHRSVLNTKPVRAARKLLHAWRKYGQSSFDFRVVLVCDPHQCEMYEQLAIEALKPRYNTRQQAAGSNLGVVWPAEVNARKWAHRANKTVQGVTGTVVSLANHFGVVTPKAAHHRMSLGWSVERAVTEPLGKRLIIAAERRAAVAARTAAYENQFEKYAIDGVTATLSVHVKERGAVSFTTAYARIKKYGWSPTGAVMTPPRGVKT